MRTKEITPPPKNAALGNATVFKTLQWILHSNRLPLNHARERALPDTAKKDPCNTQHRPKRNDAAGENFSVSSSPALERNNTDDKNPEAQAYHAADAKPCDELAMNQNPMSALT